MPSKGIPVDEMTTAEETTSRLDNLEAPDPGELVGARFLAIPLDTQKALAVNADLYGKALGLVEQWGRVVDYSTGWRTRTASTWLPKIVPPSSATVHHTASDFTSTAYILRGDPLRGLAGPLANIHVTRDGVAHILGVGYQNHAGNGDKSRYDRIAGGTAPLDRDLTPGPDGAFSANRHAVAIEANGDGGADDWTPEQRATILAICAAFHIVSGWSVEGKSARVGAHKELTTRKPGDPTTNLGAFRTEVGAIVREKLGKPSAVGFRIGVANLEGYGGSKDYAGRGRWLKEELACSVLALNESYPELMRDAIRTVLGTPWKVYVHTDGKLCVMWDSRKWQHIDRAEVGFGDSFHGALRVGLRHVANGERLDVISVHVRPKSVATDAEKEADIKLAATLYRGRSTVLAGDWAQNGVDEHLSGWTRATPDVDTMNDRDGVQAVDGAFIRGANLTTKYAITKDPGTLSDHLAWRVGLILGPPAVDPM